jgi:SAM-dependent methyltransferase
VIASETTPGLPNLREDLDLRGIGCTVLAPSAGLKARLMQRVRSDLVLGERERIPDAPWVVQRLPKRTAGDPSAADVRVPLDRVRAIWDDVTTWDPEDAPLRREYEEELAAAGSFLEDSAGWALDAGAGGGRGAALLAKHGPVAALDVSWASLKRLRERAGAPANAVHPVLGDVARLPFRAGVFARAEALQVWAHLEEPATFVAELERVLQAAAPVAVSTGNSRSLIEAWERLRMGLHELRVGEPRKALRALLGDRAYWLQLRAFARDPPGRVLAVIRHGGFATPAWTGIGLLRSRRRYIHETLSRRAPFRSLAHLLVVGTRRADAPRACTAYAALAQRAIASFLDEKGDLGYRRRGGANDARVPPYSTAERYRLISLVGLEAYRRCRPLEPSSRLPGLAKLDGKLEADDLGLLLWWKALSQAPDLDERIADVVATLPSHATLDTQSLSFLLLGLSAAGPDPRARAAAGPLAIRLLARQETNGLFYADAQRNRASTFNYQIYAVLALASFGAEEALGRARACARALCRLQGTQGQWWWTYDVFAGHVADRYPVFSVHQLGMAPIALFRLGRALGEDFGPWIRRGAAWTAGRNELAESLIVARDDTIWRSVRRRGSDRPWCARLLRRAAWYGQGWVASLLPGHEMNREHRPYEYGWLLAAIAEAGGDESWLP